MACSLEARQSHREGGTLAKLALQLDRTVHRFNDARYDPESEPISSLGLSANSLKAMEDSGLVLLRHFEPMVSDHDAHRAIVRDHLDRYGLAIAVLDRVGHEVSNDLLDAELVKVAE